MGHGNIILPSGPVVIVYKGWRRSKKKGSNDDSKTGQEARERAMSEEIAVTSMESPSIGDTFSPIKERQQQPSAVSRNFEFVNASKPLRNRDPDVRKLVRTHVMREFGRERRHQKRLKMEKPASKPESPEQPDEQVARTKIEPGLELMTPKLQSLCAGAETPFGVYPTEMKPHFHRLLQYYLTEIAHAVYPLESLLTYNPVKTVWFQLAITDKVLFHTVLLAAAAHWALANGNLESALTNLLMKPTLHLLARRLEENSGMSDGTIGAVSCLAMTENMRGNRDNYKIHIAGLHKMIRMRGGMETVNEDLHMKIFRSDLDGAVDGLTQPNLPTFERTQPRLHTTLLPPDFVSKSSAFLDAVQSNSYAFHPDLIRALFDLASFSDAVQYALSHEDITFHHRALDEEIIFIQRNLLTLPLPAGPYSSSPPSPHSPLESATHVGALIYSKYLHRESPYNYITSRILVQRLRNSLSAISPPCHSSNTAPLLVWLFFMGAISSQGTSERVWFTTNLVRLVAGVDRFPAWDSVHDMLRKVLWVEALLEAPGKIVWDEVEMTRKVLNGQAL